MLSWPRRSARGAAHTLEANPMTTEDTFRALVLDRRDNAVTAEIRRLARKELPERSVLVQVAFSSVNYKDALAVTNRGRIVSGYPIVPGIDLAGTVLWSADADVRPGDRVVVCGRGIGEEHWGGYGELARVDAEWIIRLPDGMGFQKAMVAGTAGYTAMLAAMILEERGLKPGDGDVLVTGASGGVGSFAVAALAALGHRVVALTGRPQHGAYLRDLGAAEILPRDEMAGPPPRAMASVRWAGAVDSVGGSVLANIVASLARHATVAACGLAGGPALETTVFPFILRGVNLMGVDSNYSSRRRRQEAFDRLAGEVPESCYQQILHGVVQLEDVPQACVDLLDGRVRGRTVVALG
jgi:acrylyl-CoA reductase (NADPH)